MPAQLHFSSNSKDGVANIGTIHATETKNPAGLYNQGSGEYFAYGANAHLAGSAAPSSSLHTQLGRRAGAGGGTNGANSVTLNGFTLNANQLQQQHNSNMSQHNFASFFNQTNIIGDPVVKPFTIGTPNQQSTTGGQGCNSHQQQQANANSFKDNKFNQLKYEAINQNFVAGKQHTITTTDGKNNGVKWQSSAGGVDGFAGHSASKQIGAHLV